jgi:hypothetical protein
MLPSIQPQRFTPVKPRRRWIAPSRLARPAPGPQKMQNELELQPHPA